MELEFYNLDTHPDLEIIEYDNEEHWALLRRDGIGGSDAATVMRLNKYTSPLKLYKIKKGLLTEDLSDNVFVKKGKDLEALIRDTYVVPHMHELGYVVRHPEFMMVNKQCPWLRANVDGIAVPLEPGKTYRDNIIIEIKWVSEYAENNWFGDEYCGIPVNYYAQVQHYMTVTGAKRAIVCALFDRDWKVRFFDIPFNAGFATDMLVETKLFYTNCIVNGLVPHIIPSIDKETMLDIITLPPEEKKPKTYSETVTRWCERYAYLKEELKTLETEASELHDKIIAEAVENSTYPEGDWRVTTRAGSRVSIDTTKLRKDYPEAFQACQKTTEYPITTIRRTK